MILMYVMCVDQEMNVVFLQLVAKHHRRVIFVHRINFSRSEFYRRHASAILIQLLEINSWNWSKELGICEYPCNPNIMSITTRVGCIAQNGVCGITEYVLRAGWCHRSILTTGLTAANLGEVMWRSPLKWPCCQSKYIFWVDKCSL